MQPRFTDNEIQDYLEGNFTGDVKALENFINNTEEGRKRLAAYKALFNALAEGPIPALNISLDNAVLAALDARSAKKSFNWNWILWTIIALCIVAALGSCYFFLKDLSFFTLLSDSNLLPVAIITIVAILIAFHGIDWYRQYRRYNKWLADL